MEIRTFGIINDTFGELASNDIEEFSLENFDYKKTAFVIIEDDKQRPICFFFAPDYARIQENNILMDRKELTFSGVKDSIAWTYATSYFEAEIFSARPVHLMELIEIVIEERNDKKKMFKKMRKYASKYDVGRHTDEYIVA